MEKESDDRKQPFLDVQLWSEDERTISTSVYRQKMHTDQYLFFFSPPPISHKVAIVRTTEKKNHGLAPELVTYALTWSSAMQTTNLAMILRLQLLLIER